MRNQWQARFLSSVPLSGSAPEYSFRLPSWPTCRWRWLAFSHPDGSEWFGAFEEGEIEAWTEVVTVSDTDDNFVVLAAGAPYWVSAGSHRLHYPVLSQRVSRVLAVPGCLLVVAGEDTEVLVLSPSGLEYRESIAHDFVRLTEARGVEVFGIAEGCEMAPDRSFVINAVSHAVRWL